MQQTDLVSFLLHATPAQSPVVMLTISLCMSDSHSNLPANSKHAKRGSDNFGLLQNLQPTSSVSKEIFSLFPIFNSPKIEDYFVLLIFKQFHFLQALPYGSRATMRCCRGGRARPEGSSLMGEQRLSSQRVRKNNNLKPDRVNIWFCLKIINILNVSKIGRYKI